MKEDGSGLTDAAAKKLTSTVLARYPHLGDYGIGAENMVMGNLSGLVSEMKVSN